MAEPAPRYGGPYAPRTHAWWMMLISAVLFVIAAFAFGGDALGDIGGWVWAAAAAAAYVLSWVVP